MEIEVQRKPDALSRYLKERHRKPLAIAKVRAQSQAPDSTTHVTRLVVDAISRSRQTYDRQLSRLPGSIRYRVTGAMAAWNAVRDVVDRLTSPSMTDALTRYGLPPLIRYFAKFAGNLLPYGAQGLSVEEVKAISSHSAAWLAFEVRSGAFYAPTPPLHRLLDASYIADDDADQHAYFACGHAMYRTGSFGMGIPRQGRVDCHLQESTEVELRAQH